MPTNVIIDARDYYTIDDALRQLSKRAQKNGVFREYRAAEFFIPNNQRRRTRKHAARKRRGEV